MQPAAPSAAAIDPAPVAAQDYINVAINDPSQPIVMFALEWCEFCWAVRRFLKEIGIPFRSVDLDSVALQADGLGSDIRKALRVMTGEATIPQIFIAGQWVGGAMDLLICHERGELVPKLGKVNLAPSGNISAPAMSYLPKWLASRPAA